MSIAARACPSRLRRITSCGNHILCSLQRNEKADNRRAHQVRKRAADHRPQAQPREFLTALRGDTCEAAQLNGNRRQIGKAAQGEGDDHLGVHGQQRHASFGGLGRCKVVSQVGVGDKLVEHQFFADKTAGHDRLMPWHPEQKSDGRQHVPKDQLHAQLRSPLNSAINAINFSSMAPTDKARRKPTWAPSAAASMILVGRFSAWPSSSITCSVRAASVSGSMSLAINRAPGADMKHAAIRYLSSTPSPAYPSSTEPATAAKPPTITANNSERVSLAMKGRTTSGTSDWPMKIAEVTTIDSMRLVPSNRRKVPPTSRMIQPITPM